ncbi:MAG: hypothetical protein GX900_04495 [Clostridiaceae bacterium]|nr:hypothetical protein [Clostridiaceae bacterium]
MVKIIAGKKGTGKTSRLVDMVNADAKLHDLNVVCIEQGRRLDSWVNYRARLIDISEYPIKGFRELFSFIAGIHAKDYDLDRVYIDSIYKVAQSDDMDELILFLNYLNDFTTEQETEAIIILTADVDELPEEMRQYCCDCGEDECTDCE